MLFYFKIMIISIQSLKETIETNESFGNLPTVVGFFQILWKEMYTLLKDKW